MNLWIVPAQDGNSLRNIGKSIAHPISEAAEQIIGIKGPLWAWGAQSGVHDHNVLNVMQPGDYCLLYAQNNNGEKAFRWAARIKKTFRNSALAREIWNDPSFELVFILSEVWPIHIGLPDYTQIMGFNNPNMPPRKLARTSETPLARVISQFGSIDNWLRKEPAAATPTISPQIETNAPSFPPINIGLLHSYIEAHGFFVERSTLLQFYAAIRAKPFVILAGNSGTGKSRLVRLFAEACGATIDNGGYNLVAVRPDWNDGGELLGYRDLDNMYRPGQLLIPILRAHAKPDRTVFICLDEMNLARVEHYFSDFLSKIESRRRTNLALVISDPLINPSEVSAIDEKWIPSELNSILAELDAGERGICLPPNLIVVGTVNMDETTHAFSRKVLDRAHTLEIEAGPLSTPPSMAKGTPPTPQSVDLKASFLTASDMMPDADNASKLQHVSKLLDELNDTLSEASLQVAYRTRDEAAAFFIHATAAGLPDGEAEHAIVMQKILPRVQGSSPRLARVLHKLLIRFNPGADLDADDPTKLSGQLLTLRRDPAKPALVRKLAGMWLVYIEEGFTSFWIA